MQAIRADRTLAADARSADLVRVQALIPSTANIVSEAAGRKGHLGGEVTGGRAGGRPICLKPSDRAMSGRDADELHRASAEPAPGYH
jgi:hypothetical protein